MSEQGAILSEKWIKDITERTHLGSYKDWSAYLSRTDVLNLLASHAALADRLAEAERDAQLSYDQAAAEFRRANEAEDRLATERERRIASEGRERELRKALEILANEDDYHEVGLDDSGVIYWFWNKTVIDEPWDIARKALATPASDRAGGE